MAGPRIASRDRRPCAACASPHERTAPGTVIACGPRNGQASRPRSRRAAALAPAGARPDPFRADLPSTRGVPDEPERVATDPATAGQHDTERGVRRDRRVHSRAAGPQDGQPGRGREVVRRDDRAVRASGERDRRPRPSVRERTGRAGLGRMGRVGWMSHADAPEALADPSSMCSCARSRASGMTAIPSRTSVAMNMPSMPRRSAATPPIRAPVIWPMARKTE